MKRRSLLLATLASLVGCATQPQPGEFWVEPTPAAGYLVVGWGDAPREWSSFYDTTSSVALRRVGDTKVGALSYSSKYLWQRGEKYEDADGRGTVQIRYLPAGDYELFAPSFFVLRGALSYRKPPTQTFHVRFTVREGEATYLGRFLAAAGEDMFFWLDREEVDMALARKQLPPLLQIARTTRAEVVGVREGLVIIGKHPIPKAK